MKLIVYIQSSLLLILFAGCTTPATKSLNKESMVRDPQIEEYHKAFESREYVFLNYSVSEPTEPNQKKVAESYWARIPKNELDDYRFKKWEVCRAENPPDLPREEFTAIEILDLASYTKPTNQKFHNKDQYLTYIIDSNEYTPLSYLSILVT